MFKLVFRSTAPEVLERLASKISTATEDGMDAAGKATREDKKKNVRRTYRKAIPRTASGALRYVRTGDFLAGQVMERVGRFARIVHTNNNAARYEEGLIDLATGADGINRSNPASPDKQAMLDQADNPARDAFEKALGDRLGL